MADHAAAHNDDEDEIEKILADNAKLRAENLRLKHKGPKKADPLASLKAQRDQLKLNKEVYELKEYRGGFGGLLSKLGWKGWAIIAALLLFFLVSKAPPQEQQKLVDLASIPVGLFVLYLFLRIGGFLRGGKSGGEKKSGGGAHH